MKKTLLTHWMEARELLAAANKVELRLREEVIKLYGSPVPDAEGAFRLPEAREEDEGALVTVTHKLNRKVEDETLALHLITKEKELEVAYPLERSFSLTGFRKLSAQQQAVFGRCLAVKPGLASVEVKPGA